MNKIKKVFISLLLIMSILGITMVSFAANGAFVDPDGFNSGVSTRAQNATENLAGTAITVIRIVAVAIAIIMLLAVSMKYMMSSANDRADIKKHAVAYVVGAFIIFGAVGILGIISDIANNIN